MTFGGESPGEIGACPSTVSWLPISSENWFLFSSELAVCVTRSTKRTMIHQVSSSCGGPRPKIRDGQAFVSWAGSGAG